jgi:hypothetical protein
MSLVFFGIFEKLVLFLDNDIDIDIQIDYPNPDPCVLDQ